MPDILLVEDNAMNSDMLSRRLERRGFSVTCAGNGLDGVEQARARTPNLILMDIGLPEMDGLEATRVLKADERTRDIPVIALTAHAMMSDRRKAFDSGCDDFATKPIDFASLVDTIHRLLGDPPREAP